MQHPIMESGGLEEHLGATRRLELVMIRFMGKLVADVYCGLHTAGCILRAGFSLLLRLTYL